MRVVERTTESIDQLIAFYESQGYSGGASENDKIFLAYEDDELICVVRIALENEVPVLRGMYMREDKRGNGLGKTILKTLEPSLSAYQSPCYCIPKSKLQSFYGTVGFNRIKDSDAPQFLQNRMRGYLKEGYDVVLMKRDI